MRKMGYTIIFTFTVIIFFYILGCKSPNNPDALKPNRIENGSAESSKEAGKVILELTYPAGKSPKVFSSGWIFGARCLINPGTKDQQDISNQVRWSGDAVFSPVVGDLSRPAFNKAGENVIVLEAVVGGKTVHQQYTISAVSPLRYAGVNDKAYCPSDAHGCPACPHPVSGPITTGSPDVLLNGLPAARVGDTGVHASCCGPNTFKIVEGDPEVLINGKPAARFGDKTQHCGGIGKIEGQSQSSTIPATTSKTSPPSVSTISSPSQTYSNPVVKDLAGTVSIEDYGQQQATVYVFGGKPPYYYEWVGTEVLFSGSSGATANQIVLKKSQFKFDGQTYSICVTVKDSNGQYATWKDPSGTLQTRFTFGYKYDSVKKSWVIFTEPKFPY